MLSAFADSSVSLNSSISLGLFSSNSSLSNSSNSDTSSEKTVYAKSVPGSKKDLKPSETSLHGKRSAKF